jgi:hypothetical protein
MSLTTAPAAESAVLGCILINPSQYDAVDWLEDQDFTLQENLVTWRAIRSIAEEGGIPDHVCVLSNLGMGKANHLAGLMGSPVASSAYAYAREVRLATWRRAVAGGALPEQAPEVPPVNADKTDKADNPDTCGHLRTPSGHFPDTFRTPSGQSRTGFIGNLSGEIRNWILNSEGSFTVAQLDREFGLTTRRQKKSRSDALLRIEKEKYIRKDSRVTGKYHITSKNVSFFTVSEIKTEAFDVRLPFGLDEKVRIPPKGLVLLAGSSNAGKTALILNTLHANLSSPHEIIYLLREGVSEYARRAKKFEDPRAWERIKVAEVTTGFGNIVRTYNPEGMTFIDYIKEEDGEYFRIASDIQDVADALTTGIAFVAIQKASGATFGRGGEATQEAARLYLSLDKLCDLESSSVNSIRIVKAKDYGDSNPNGLELHFKLSHGVKVEVLQNWTRIDDKERQSLIKNYKQRDNTNARRRPDTAPF